MTTNRDGRGRILNTLLRFGSAISLCVMSFTAPPFAVAQAPPVPNSSALPRQSKPISDVVVPIPSEVFGSLDQFVNSNWRAVQHSALGGARPHGDQVQIALLLGAVIAEGFIAVEAEDAAEVKEIGNAVLTLARALGVESTVLRRSGSIVEYSEKKDWAAVRKEWDGVLPDVQEGMTKLESGQLSQLVSLGGWLRGTQALTALILQRHPTESAELLQQPAMLDYFEKQLSAMGPNTSVQKMLEGVRKMRALVAGSNQPVSDKSVKAVATLCDELLAAIEVRAGSR